MEYWDIYNNSGMKTGKQVAKSTPMQDGEYHLAMEAWIAHPHQELFLIQKRSHQCEILPGKWAMTTGRMVAGEDSRQGCVRELAEELGIQIAPREPQFLQRMFRADTGLMWDLYLITKDIDTGALSLQPEEVEQAKWASPEEIRRMAGEGTLVTYPTFFQIMEICSQQAWQTPVPQ